MAGPSSPVPAGARLSGRRRRRRPAADRRLRDPVRDVFEHVEPRDALLGEQARRLGLRLLENGRADVAGLHLLPLRALHVQHGGLQHAAEGRRLFGLPLLAARDLLDRLVEVGVQVAPQPLQIGAARDQDPLAVGIVARARTAGARA